MPFETAFSKMVDVLKLMRSATDGSLKKEEQLQFIEICDLLQPFMVGLMATDKFDELFLKVAAASKQVALELVFEKLSRGGESIEWLRRNLPTAVSEVSLRYLQDEAELFRGANQILYMREAVESGQWTENDRRILVSMYDRLEPSPDSALKAQLRTIGEPDLGVYLRKVWEEERLLFSGFAPATMAKYSDQFPRELLLDALKVYFELQRKIETTRLDTLSLADLRDISRLGKHIGLPQQTAESFAGQIVRAAALVWFNFDSECGSTIKKIAVSTKRLIETFSVAHRSRENGVINTTMMVIFSLYRNSIISRTPQIERIANLCAVIAERKRCAQRAAIMCKGDLWKGFDKEWMLCVAGELREFCRLMSYAPEEERARLNNLLVEMEKFMRIHGENVSLKLLDNAITSVLAGSTYHITPPNEKTGKKRDNSSSSSSNVDWGKKPRQD